MRRELQVLGLLAFAATAFAAGPSHAQTAPEANIEERLRPPELLPLPPTPPQDLIITGREDLLLLRERKLFALSVGAAGRYTTNAFLSDDRSDDDFVFSPDINLRAATRIAGQFDVFAEAGIGSSRYVDNEVLDFDNLSFGLGVSAPVEPVRLSFSYRPSLAFATDFGRRLVTLHDLSISADSAITLSPEVSVTPSVTLTRTFADPDDFESISGAVAGQFVYAVDPQVVVVGGPALLVRSYDGYFRDSIGEDRIDVSLSLGAGAYWAPHEAVLLSATLSFAHNLSTIDANDYTVFSIGPAARATLRF